MITSKTDRLSFGKYKGKTVEEIVEKERPIHPMVPERVKLF